MALRYWEFRKSELNPRSTTANFGSEMYNFIWGQINSKCESRSIHNILTHLSKFLWEQFT